MKNYFMKKILSAAMLLAFFEISIVAVAQQNKYEIKSLPKWLPDKGYWNIESNIKQPKKCTVYFYTNNQIKIYSKVIDGVRINLNRRKTLIRLKEALDKALLDWEQSKLPQENLELVKTIFKVR